MRLILSTRNRSKAEQIKALLANVPGDIVTLSEANIEGEAVEDGNTLEDNATKKARFAHDKTGEWSLAEDSGLFIDALDGKPGIYAARWAGEDKTTEEIRDFTLDQLRDVSKEKRTAQFRTTAVVISPVGETRAFTGSIKGEILIEPRSESQPDMPYSTIFRPFGIDKTWAEMTVEEENEISHRGIAFRKVEAFLRQYFK